MTQSMAVRRSPRRPHPSQPHVALSVLLDLISGRADPGGAGPPEGTYFNGRAGWPGSCPVSPLRRVVQSESARGAGTRARPPSVGAYPMRLGDWAAWRSRSPSASSRRSQSHRSRSRRLGSLPFPSYVFRRRLGIIALHRAMVIPGSVLRLEVGDLRYWDLNAWQQLGNALLDALALLWWTLVAGLVAFGGCWYLGRFMYAEWVREHPPPRLRFHAERRLRRDLDRGLADLEEYLGERDPARLNHGDPRRPGQSLTWRRQARRRYKRSRADR